MGVPAADTYALNAAQLLNLGSTPVYLHDLPTGAVVDLARPPRDSFTVSNATALIAGRFELVFTPQAVLATALAALAAQVGLYPNPARATAFVALPAALGRVAYCLDLAELPTGLDTLHLRTSAGVVVKQFVVE